MYRCKICERDLEKECDCEEHTELDNLEKFEHIKNFDLLIHKDFICYVNKNGKFKRANPEYVEVIK